MSAAVPLDIVLVSDAVAQSALIQRAITKDTVAVTCRGDDMTAANLLRLLRSLSAEHDSAKIRHLGIVAHGRPAELDLGPGNTLDLNSLPGWSSTLRQLGFLFTDNARLDLYACSLAAGENGRAFVDRLSALTGATVFASSNLVGTVPGADLALEYRRGRADAGGPLFSTLKLEAIPGLCLSLRPPTPTEPGTTSDTGYTISTLTPTLQWVPASCAQYYYVGIWENPSGNQVCSFDHVYGTSVAVPDGKLQAGKKYNWEIQSCAASSVGGYPSTSYSGFSSPFYFQTKTTVPNVVGMSVDQARTSLTSSGLAVVVVEQSSAAIPDGQVISQDPAGGSQASAGAQVHLVVSSGPPLPEEPKVPDVVHKPVDQARTSLAGAGYTVLESQQSSETVAAGLVISQTPPAGSAAAAGTQVQLVVSSGPGSSNVTVPDVSRLSVAQADTTLTAAGFAVAITEQSSDTLAPGQVISQNPMAGSQAPAGTQVHLAISTGSEESDGAGCFGAKKRLNIERLKDVFGDLFVAGLSAAVLLTLSRGRE